MKSNYGLDISAANFVPIADGGGPATVKALSSGDITAANIFTTSASIPENNFVVLEDPKNNFPAQNVVPVLRASKSSDKLKTVLDAVSAKLTTEELLALNVQVSGDTKTEPAAAAKAWVTAQASTSRSRSHVITFEGVTKQYPDGTTAVDRLDLTIEAESFTVFVGPSGCGKTTSMRMINRMITPTSGKIFVDGRDIAQTDAVKLRLGIGYVIQNAGLLPHRTVIDNVATVPVLRGESRRAARKAALGVLERVGLDISLATRYPGQLSGGQQQRVGVARALAADPPILLMDEPFSAVDPGGA